MILLTIVHVLYVLSEGHRFSGNLLEIQNFCAQKERTSSSQSMVAPVFCQLCFSIKTQVQRRETRVIEQSCRTNA